MPAYDTYLDTKTHSLAAQPNEHAALSNNWLYNSLLLSHVYLLLLVNLDSFLNAFFFHKIR